MMYHRIWLTTRNTTGVTSWAGTAFTHVSPEFTPSFCWFVLLNFLFSVLLTIVCLFFLFLLHILFCVPFQPKTVILTFYTFLLEHTTIKSKNNHMFTWNYYSVSTVEWYVYMQTVLIQWSKKWSPRGNQTLSSHKQITCSYNDTVFTCV